MMRLVFLISILIYAKARNVKLKDLIFEIDDSNTFDLKRLALNHNIL
jgi:hypothetical protein